MEPDCAFERKGTIGTLGVCDPATAGFRGMPGGFCGSAICRLIVCVIVMITGGIAGDEMARAESPLSGTGYNQSTE